MFAFPARAHGAVGGGAWRGIEDAREDRDGTSGVVRASPVTHVQHSQLRRQVGRWPVLGEPPVPWGQQVGLAQPVSHAVKHRKQHFACVVMRGITLTSSLKMLMWEVRVRGGPCAHDHDTVYDPSCLQALPCAMWTGHGIWEGEARVILGRAGGGSMARWSWVVASGGEPAADACHRSSLGKQPSSPATAALAVRQPLP